MRLLPLQPLTRGKEHVHVLDFELINNFVLFFIKDLSSKQNWIESYENQTKASALSCAHVCIVLVELIVAAEQKLLRKKGCIVGVYVPEEPNPVPHP